MKKAQLIIFSIFVLFFTPVAATNIDKIDDISDISRMVGQNNRLIAYECTSANSYYAVYADFNTSSQIVEIDPYTTGTLPTPVIIFRYVDSNGNLYVPYVFGDYTDSYKTHVNSECPYKKYMIK